MKSIVSLTLLSALVVAGSGFEATEGQNVTLFFHIDEVEKAEEVRITFEDHKEKRVIAQKPWIFKEPPPAGVSLLVERGRVSVTILHVNDSRSGLYEARAFGKNVLTENATLVVNKAPVSSNAAPPHSPTPKPATSDLHWLWLGLGLGFGLPIVILGGVCFWKHRKRARSVYQITAAFSVAFSTSATDSKSFSSLSVSDPESPNKELGKTIGSECVAVAMDGCGENPEAVLSS